MLDATGKQRQLQTTKLKYVDPAGRQCVLGMCADVTDTHAQMQANSMIIAMAADYRYVYYVNLDENDGVCYRDDPSDAEQTPAGVHFPYLERFTWYAENSVAEMYREGFLDFIDPDNIRRRLSTQPLIAYRYLAKREGREYYEMIRAAGVRRTEERDDHMVHAIGLGLTKIDTEMRETMAKNEALAEALSLAEEASKAKTTFLSNMSHEIRTPMNAIIGLDTLALRDETLTPQTREYLEKIGGSARHLLALINDILDMSRIESGRLVLRKEEFSFSGMLEQINTMVMSQCSDKGLHYECRILSHVDDYYIGDDMKLKEVLINILSNAIKFTDAPGSVTLTLERTAHRNNMSLFKEKKRAALAGRRILLAEDMEINAEIMMDVLEMEDMETDHAENGRIVVDMFKNSAPGTYSAILMDVRMPVMDGLEATAAIRALDRPDAKRIPIIALTANAFDEDVQHSLQAGMNAHLSKPVEPNLLYQTLGELIYGAKAE